MSRTFTLHNSNSQLVSNLMSTTTPNYNPVVQRGQAPKGVRLSLPRKFLGRSPSRGGAMAALCNDLAIYGCNVNPTKAGTTAGERKVISRRNISKFS